MSLVTELASSDITLGKSVSHALSFEFLAPLVFRFWHKMKTSGLPICLLSAVFYLFWTPSAGLKTLHLGSCVITTNLQEMRNGFSEIRDSVVSEGGNSPLPLWLPLSFSTCPSLSSGSPAVWSQKETGWGLHTRRMHSQERAVVHSFKVFSEETLHWAVASTRWERPWCLRPGSSHWPVLSCLAFFHLASQRWNHWHQNFEEDWVFARHKGTCLAHRSLGGNMNWRHLHHPGDCPWMTPTY